MAIRFTALLCVLTFSILVAQADDKERAKSDVTKDNKPEHIAKAMAEEAAEATVKGDFGKVLDLTYPEIVKQGGGRAKLVESMTKEMKDWKKRGIEFRSAKVGETAQLVAGGDKLFSVVPFNLEMKVPGGTLSVSSFMLGVSSDKGKTWTFINGDKARDEAVKKMLPDLPATLRLPERKKPVFKEDE